MAKQEGTRQTGEAMVICTTPDVCKTPMGPNLVPVPYQIVAYFSMSSATEPTVRMTMKVTFTIKSKITMVVGDEPGVGGGVKSGVNKSICEPIKASSTVNAKGAAIVRHDDPFQMNNGNTVGRVVYPIGMAANISPAAGPEADTNPPVELTPQEAQAAAEGKGFLGQVGGFFKGVYKGGEETVTGLWGMGKAVVTDPAGAWESTKTVAGAVWDDPMVVVDAVTKPITDAWAAGEYGEAIGRGTFEAVGVLFGTKGVDKLGKAGKLGTVADKIGDVAKAGDKLGDVAKVGDKVSDVAKTGDKVSDVAKAADKVDDVAGGGANAGRVAEKAPTTPDAPEPPKTPQPKSGEGQAAGGGGDGTTVTKAPKKTPPINEKHIFDGEVNKKGKPTGYHHREGGVDPSSARVTSHGPPDSNGVYQADVEVFDPSTNTWKGPKSSSMFPDSWSKGQVMNEIDGAFQNGVVTGNKWSGVSPSGVKIEGYLGPNGSINTAYPIFGGK